jgi:hypothetical protein
MRFSGLKARVMIRHAVAKSTTELKAAHGSDALVSNSQRRTSESPLARLGSATPNTATRAATERLPADRVGG